MSASWWRRTRASLTADRTGRQAAEERLQVGPPEHVAPAAAAATRGAESALADGLADRAGRLEAAELRGLARREERCLAVIARHRGLRPGRPLARPPRRDARESRRRPGHAARSASSPQPGYRGRRARLPGPRP